MKILYLFGPTSVGKSCICLNLFDKIYFEIISVDSTSIYKDMNIGTDKPKFDFLNQIKHYLIDIKYPTDNYSVINFCTEALFIINNFFLNKKIFLFIGGTMMYFWCLQYCLFILSNFSLFYLRKMNIFCKTNNYFMYNLFVKLYPYTNIKFVNIFHLNKHIKMLLLNFFDLLINLTIIKFDILYICLLSLDNFSIFKNINLRFNNMIKNGFLNEVDFLIWKYKFNEINFIIDIIGYKHAIFYLKGIINFFDFKKEVMLLTNKLVKKQLAWMKKWNGKLFCIENNTINVLTKILKLMNL